MTDSTVYKKEQFIIMETSIRVTSFVFKKLVCFVLQNIQC